MLVAGGASPLDQWKASPPPPLPPLMHAPSALSGSCRPEHQAILRVADALNVFRGKHALSLLPPADCLRWYAAAAGVRGATQLAGELGMQRELTPPPRRDVSRVQRRLFAFM